MYALSQIVIGLVVAHLLWAMFYLTGSIVWGSEPERELSSGRAMLLLVVATASGVAVYVFEGIACGFAGLLNPVGLSIAIAINALSVLLLSAREKRGEWWLTRWRVARSAIASPAVLSYYVMLVVSAHAALPDYSDDGVRYHLTYAYEWFNAGRIIADHHFRFPYYTFNGEMLYAWMFVLRLGRYVPFLSWMTGTIAVLSVYGLISVADEAAQRGRSIVGQGAARVIYAIAPLSVVIAAVFLRWVDTAMPDATSSMFFSAAAAGIVLALAGSPVNVLFGSALATAFLAGMKPTYVLLIALFAPLIMLAGRRMSRRNLAVCLALLFLLSTPWYIRNLVEDRDPLPPILHNVLGTVDPDISRADLEGMKQDLRMGTLTLRAVEAYPLRLFRETDTSEFREYGVSAVVLVLYPVTLLGLFLVFKVKKTEVERSALCLFTITLGGYLYLFATSLLARYALIVYPLTAASAGTAMLYCADRVRFGIVMAPLLAALLVVPSRSATRFEEDFSDTGFNSVASIMPDDTRALERQLGGYKEAEPLLESRPWNSRFPNVLLISADIQYYVASAGGQPIGDWMGRIRYSDFAAAVDDDDAIRYLNAHRAAAVVIKSGHGALVPAEEEFLRQQLLGGGFKELSSSTPQYRVFVRTV